MHKFAPLFAGVLMMTGCGRDSASRFREMSDEFVYTAVSFSPSGATSTGLHQYSNQNLDDMLDDVTPASLDRQRQFYRQFRQRLAALGTSGLDAEDLADMGIIQDQISLALLDLDEIHSALHNPTIYVETLGNAIFSPYVLEYAPKDQRLRHIISRLQKTPAYLNQARKNLESSPEVWTSVAIEENDGNIGLVEQTIRKEVPAALRAAYDAAAEPALDAMRQFQVYLKNDLAHRNQADWRLGKDRYTRKFRHTLLAPFLRGYRPFTVKIQVGCDGAIKHQ
jgi:uncharacterized protein (DUF885 family)